MTCDEDFKIDLDYLEKPDGKIDIVALKQALMRLYGEIQELKQSRRTQE